MTWPTDKPALTKVQRFWLNLLSGEERDSIAAHRMIHAMPTRTLDSLLKRGYVDGDGLTSAGYDALAWYL